jgi:hypothetical protein
MTGVVKPPLPPGALDELALLAKPPLPPAARAQVLVGEIDDGTDLLARATALEIPWERLLRREIAAETTIRAFFVEVNGSWPLWAALAALPFSPLHSWRVRDRLEALSSEARSVGCQTAARQLRAFFRHLCGKASGCASAPALARHLWFAYQRVLVLQRVGRAAHRTQGTHEERIDFVQSKTGCCRADAEWAIAREDQPSRSHLLDDAMRKARSEGFEIPHFPTEAKAFRRLRSIARSSPHLVPRFTALLDGARSDGDE